MNSKLLRLLIASLLLSLLVIYSLTCFDQVSTKRTCNLDCLLKFSLKRLDAMDILYDHIVLLEVNLIYTRWEFASKPSERPMHS